MTRHGAGRLVAAAVGPGLLAVVLASAPVAAAAPLASVAGTAAAAPRAGATTGPGPTRVTTVADPRISESSALAASVTHPDLVWTVNDSGHTATVFGVSTATGRTRVVLRLADTDARDWESMALQRLPAGAGTSAAGSAGSAGSVLWIGDTGDNREVRESVVLRLVREPARLPSTEGATVTVAPVSLRVRYPDGPHDVEALVVTPDGRLLLVSKGIFSGIAYQVPPAAVAAALAGRSTLDPVTALVVGPVRQSLVTDGAALPDGRIVLRGYYDAVVYQDLVAKGQGLRPLQRIDLPEQQQGEGLAVVDGGAALLLSSEGVRQPLWRVPLTAPGDRPAGTAPATTGAPPVSAEPGSPGTRSAGDGVLRRSWPVGTAAVGVLVLSLVWGVRRRRR